MNYYEIKKKQKLAEWDKVFPLDDYFKHLIGDKKEVHIADLGAGPVSTTGSTFEGVKVRLYPSDKHRYHWDVLIPIEYQDMEQLTYPDETFDIVHLKNSIDHTKNPRKALQEAERACKKGGWVYLKHAPYQRKRFGGHHYWDIYQEGNDCVFESKNERFILEGFKTTFESGTHDNWITSIKKV